MPTSRSIDPSELSWPPTCAFYVHRLHRALKLLVRQAERFGSGHHGYPEAAGEKRLWEVVYGVEVVLSITGIEPDYMHFRDVLIEAEPWLRNVLSELPSFDRRNPPPESREHACQLASADRLGVLREILSLIPDPFDTPKGDSRRLYEWARYHLGTTWNKWNFVDNTKLPEWFGAEWQKVLSDFNEESRKIQSLEDSSERHRVLREECRKRQRDLLIQADLLRLEPLAKTHPLATSEPRAESETKPSAVATPGVEPSGEKRVSSPNEAERTGTDASQSSVRRVGPVREGEPAMAPWLRSLAELRTRLVARIDDDLNFLEVTASVPINVLRSYGNQDRESALDDAVENAIALPHDHDPAWGDDGWRSGKPIIRDLRAVREAKQLPYFRTDPNCKPEDDPAYKRAVENYEKEAAYYWHYSRHVLFGTVDKSSVEAFDRWADQAGRYIYAWSVLNFKKEGLNILKKIDDSGHDYWMGYILFLAKQRIRGCPLVVKTNSSPRGFLGEFDGPHWVLLKSNLFQASVDAIDTVLWRFGAGSGASGPNPTTGTAAPEDPETNTPRPAAHPADSRLQCAASDDPVERAAALIASSPLSVKLIRYLAQCNGLKAHLDDIAVALDKAPKSTAGRRRGTIRQRYLRAQETLEESRAPVALTIDKNIIGLVIVDHRPERTTSV